MDKPGDKPIWIDRVLEGASRRIATGSTRRSLLARLSTLLLGAVGVKVVAAAPFKPHLYEAAINESLAQDPCSAWEYCGIHGYPCSLCNPNDGDETCPAGTTMGTGYWAACCADTASYSWTLWYYDCCATPAAVTCPPNICKGSKDCDQANLAWCPGFQNYNCTIYFNTGTFCG
jgi:methylamine dehydrogenase light chain